MIVYLLITFKRAYLYMIAFLNIDFKDAILTNDVCVREVNIYICVCVSVCVCVCVCVCVKGQWMYAFSIYLVLFIIECFQLFNVLF